MTWEIESLTSPGQIDDVLAIEEASFTNPWTRQMYLSELENRGVSYCFLAKDANGHIVAFCSFWRVLDELHINSLAVIEAWRRRGLARHLLRHVFRESIASGARSATLEVRQSNRAARALYEGLGFRAEGARRDYYQDPREDALVLWHRSLADTTVLC